jgi:hypothetical protein
MLTPIGANKNTHANLDKSTDSFDMSNVNSVQAFDLSTISPIKKFPHPLLESDIASIKADSTYSGNIINFAIKMILSEKSIPSHVSCFILANFY